MAETVFQLENVSFAYDRKTPVVRDLSYAFEAGKTYAIIGRSGAGKTTLLSMMSGLLRPVRGQIFYKGHDIARKNQFVYRSHDVGVVFQSYNLLPKLTALENVQLSMDISRVRIRRKKEVAASYLRQVGLSDMQMKRRVLQLSGGEQQRVAIARAICFQPGALLADEPTGNLDVATTAEIMRLFTNLAHEEGKCIIIVTHSPQVAQMSDIVYNLSGNKGV